MSPEEVGVSAHQLATLRYWQDAFRARQSSPELAGDFGRAVRMIHGKEREWNDGSESLLPLP